MRYTDRLAPARTALTIVLAVALVSGAAYVFLSRPPAPDIEFKTLNGEAMSLRNLRGKVVYVNFWATSCATCIQEMPDLVRTYERYGPRGFELLAVAMHYDPPTYVEHYTNKYKLPFKVVLDTTGSVAAAFGGVTLTPTAVLIDKQARIFSRFVGEPDLASLHAAIEDELAD
jgi:peroxiredoxin